MKKVLIVEDDKEARWGLCHFLRKEGHEVTEAENGLRAYLLIKQESRPFDVIISDLKMPEMNGLDLLKQCKRDKYPAAFVLMTAYGDCQSFCDILSSGAFEYLNKPVSLVEITELLNKIPELHA